MKLNANLTKKILMALCGTYNSSGSPQSPESKVDIGSYGNCWLGLFNGEPTNGGAELSGHGYERVNIHEHMNNNYQSYALGETENKNHDRRIGNQGQISFSEAIRSPILVDAEHGGRWNTATHWAMFASKGALAKDAIAWGELEEPITVDTHQVFIIRRGHLELYMEPDVEYVYFGAYESEEDFVNAIRANEKVTDPQELTIGRDSVTERKRTIANLDVTDKFLFFAYPVDFKGLPVFRGNGEADGFGDIQYQEYAAQRMPSAPICKSYYVTTKADNETVVMADRDNAYYVYRVYGLKDKYVLCESKPSDWEDNWKLYYTHHTPITSKTAPTFVTNTFYSYNVQNGYALLISEPENWSNNYKNYYAYNAVAYMPVKDKYYTHYVPITDETAPTFVPDTFYSYNAQNGYALLISEPENWSDNYNNYYTYNAVADTSVRGGQAPTYQANTYFALEELTGTKTFDVF